MSDILDDLADRSDKLNSVAVSASDYAAVQMRLAVASMRQAAAEIRQLRATLAKPKLDHAAIAEGMGSSIGTPKTAKVRGYAAMGGK